MMRILALGALALALGGCAAGPYYDEAYGYGPSYYDGPSYYGAPSYYYGPSVGFGYYYYDNDGARHWRDRRDDRGWNRDHDGTSLPDRPDRGYRDDGRHGNLAPWELRNDPTRSGGPNSDRSAVQQ